MKLWLDKDLDKEVEKFTVGNDYLLDARLLNYDCIASIAHAKMLHKIGALSGKESKSIVKVLIDIQHDKSFKISPEDEDCHTAIENYLVTRLGSVGKKIHLVRSRNDQVLTALRLYEKDELKQIKSMLFGYKKSLNNVVSRYGTVRLPGFTHTRKAMPTTIAVWFGSFADSLNDNILLLATASKLIDQSPLGSAAGFGVPIFKIDRKFSSKLMHFSKVMENPMYCQLSRGKFESTIIHVCSQIMFDLNKLASDIILFSMPEFGFFALPKNMCTGSSIMPQKENPDLLELVRAKYYFVLGEEFKVQSIASSLISGYNRDLQLTKEPLFVSIDTTKDCLNIMSALLNNLSVDKAKCKKALTRKVYATEHAFALVKKGVPFRDAYNIIAQKLKRP
ncbi:MAG: argininosuccinate lyase [Candidatus Woesearchaeota archaeon]